MLQDEDHQEWARSVVTYVMGLISTLINQSIPSWAVEVHVCTVVLTIRPSNTYRELHRLDDKEG